MTNTMEPREPEWIAPFRAAAARLAAHRRRPCLVFQAASIRRPLILDVRRALGEAPPDALDVVVSSPGGDLDSAYVIARELRRHVHRVAAYVPLMAKSAATLLCLAADELVLGSLGELGPLDAQYDEKQQADFPVTLSRLAPFTALSHLKDGVMAFYDEAVGRILQRSGMRPFEACSQAAELTSAIYRTIYQQIDPNRLAESARGLEIGCEYGVRVLRRYRPDVSAKDSEQLIHRLVHAYPSHGFVLDLEELAELGLPVRAAEDGPERHAVEAFAQAIIEAPEDATLVELVRPAEKDGGGADRAREPVDTTDLEIGDPVVRPTATPSRPNGTGHISGSGPERERRRRSHRTTGVRPDPGRAPAPAGEPLASQVTGG